MFMRLIGYPAESITILTTYNGQKHLIRDVIKQRCANIPFIGSPSKVSYYWPLIMFKFDSNCGFFKGYNCR